VYKLTGEITPEGKKIGRAHTLTEGPNLTLWKEHLTGKKGLGIIPINEDNNAHFGAIDVDIYDINHGAVIKKIADNKMPLVCVRSKSGGLHLYLFVSEWMPAGIIIHKLTEMAAFLGHGGSEIFPKQKSLKSKNDRGNWINMPYFLVEKTERYAYDYQRKRLKLDEFIKLAYAMRLEPDALISMQYGVKKEILTEGPPCLNHLVINGFPAGTRNIGLFNLGVYAKKKNPDDWEKLTREYAAKHLTPPLTTTEVNSVIKSLSRQKDYSYQCHQFPMSDHCFPAKCRTRAHGVGGAGEGLPKLGSLTKVLTTPVTWIFDIEAGGRMQVSSEQLSNQSRYKCECMEQCSVIFQPMKSEVWTEFLKRLFEDISVVELPEEATPQGELREHLNNFLSGKHSANAMEEILLGKIWTFNNLCHFKLSAFMGYLDRHRFKEYKRNRVSFFLKEWGAEKAVGNFKGRCCNYFKFPAPPSENPEQDIPPELRKEQPL
jgi:hypothetical protein